MGQRASALRAVAIGSALALAGCGEEGAVPQALPDGGGGGPDAGSECGPLEVPAAGACARAGVPPEACAPGFEGDERGGCAPILPERACTAGTMALPGETACREVASCGNGTWGEAPEGADTQHVDASYAGGDGDGTAAKPWTTIQAGIDAAKPGAVVAVAAGSYPEDLLIDVHPVRLWGRCPGEVEIAGTGAELAAVRILTPDAEGAEIHDLAVTGAATGIAVVGAKDVILDRVWVHDTKSRGLDLISEGQLTAVRVSGALIERTREIGVWVVGSDMIFEAGVVRDTEATAAKIGGAAVFVRWSDLPARRGKATLRSSVLERSVGVALLTHGADAEIDATLVQDTAPEASKGADGVGLAGYYEPTRKERASLSVARSVVRTSHLAGIALVGTDGSVDATTVRDTGAQASDGLGGTGLVVQVGDDASRTVASVTRSLFADSLGMGIFVAESDLTMDASIVSSAQPLAVDGSYGDALLVASYGGQTTASVTGSRIERGARAGISCFSAGVTLGGSVIDCSAIDLDGENLPMLPEYQYLDLGGNVCGCSAPTDGSPAASGACKVLSAGLTPPPPLH